MDNIDSKTPTLGGTPEDRIQRYFCVDDDGCHAFERLSRDAEVVNREPKTVLVNGKEVMAYTEPQYDPRDADAKKLIKGDALSLKAGYISLQSESHPVEFRKVELMVLEK